MYIKRPVFPLKRHVTSRRTVGWKSEPMHLDSPDCRKLTIA